MLLPEDQFVLSEFQKAIRKSNQPDVLDLDQAFTHKFDFQVQRFEDIFVNSSRAVPPNRWSYHRIGLITRGEADFHTGMYQFRAAKNTMVIIPSRVISSSKNWSLDVKGYIVLFNLNFFLQQNFPHKYIENRKILSPSIKPNIELNTEQAEEVMTIFEQIIAEKQSIDKLKEELIALKIVELLILAERFYEEDLPAEMKTGNSEIIRRFGEMLDSGFTKEHSVKYYADKLSVHPNYLNALVKKQTGFSAKEIIQQRIILESKFLLHTTALSIKEIAGQVGFSDPDYFTSFFRRLEQTSPLAYRVSVI